MTDRLTDIELKVLGALALRGTEFFLPFNQIAADTGLLRNDVAQACRSLRERGLAEYSSNLWNEETNRYD